MNAANILTIFRFILIPIIVAVFNMRMPNYEAIAGVIIIIASGTDILDGYIARKYNMITNIGKILDPMADKLMALTVITCMTVHNLIPLPFLIILLIKDGLMIVGSAFLFKKKISIESNIFGKASTVFLTAAILAILFFNMESVARDIILYIALICAVVAFIQYVILYLVRYKKVGKESL